VSAAYVEERMDAVALVMYRFPKCGVFYGVHSNALYLALVHRSCRPCSAVKAISWPGSKWVL